MDYVISIFQSLAEPAIVVIIVFAILVFNSWAFNRIKSLKWSGNVAKRTIAFTTVLIGGLVFILSLPIDKSLKGNILSFLGIVISAGIALSSTTILGNLIAGLMNNSMNRFRNGDLIRIGDIQGRVTRRSAFHTEIQLEDSNFVTLPNLYVATHPVKLTRKTNTVISTTVSLGYDVSRTKIEEALIKAANEAGLSDPYVYITQLDDFSVCYKIHGFLDDSNKFFSTNSLLNGKVMDLLHQYKIEIVSPNFVNQRRVDEQIFIPKHIEIETEAENVDSKAPEDLIFDEATKSEAIEKKKEHLQDIIQSNVGKKERLKTTNSKVESEKLKQSIKKADELIKKLEENIKNEEEQNEAIHK
ncbi:MAG: mechanosensitive ion channel [Prolixibacteraceae bacterium]|nr:mechanosensitive ion channel [Prolixibacteraceae bacterium]MBN2648999.1 mechanosensitive ion channel [Prolixibacteraceae bacterium]